MRKSPDVALTARTANPSSSAAHWRSSTPTTPQTSPPLARRSGGGSLGLQFPRTAAAEMALPTSMGFSVLRRRKDDIFTQQQQKQQQQDPSQQQQEGEKQIWGLESRRRLNTQGRLSIIPLAAEGSQQVISTPATATTTTTTVGIPIVSKGNVPTPAASLPLYEQPGFRTDLMRRSVFIFGLQTVEECSALLQLLKTQCGAIAGAFRLADHTWKSSNLYTGGNYTNTMSAGVGSPSFHNNNNNINSNNNNNNGGCVVLCVAFYTPDSAVLAQRLDNTAQVYQSRFVVESATRFQGLSYQTGTEKGFSLYSSSPSSSSSSSSSTTAIHINNQSTLLPPQHERLWQLLFSPIDGGVKIDWRAAAAAVERGEALLIKPTSVLSTQIGVWNTHSSGEDAGEYSMEKKNSHPIMNSGIINTSSNTTNNNTNTNNSISGGSEGARWFDTTRTMPSLYTSTSNMMNTAGNTHSDAASVGFEMDALGRSNTLQQQYYSNRYERRSLGSGIGGGGDSNNDNNNNNNNNNNGSGIPFFSSITRVASSLLQMAFGSNNDNTNNNNINNHHRMVGGGDRHDDVYLPPPLRQRVETGTQRTYYNTSSSSSSIPTTIPTTTTMGGERRRGAADENGEEVWGNTNTVMESTDDGGAAYIPRMRSIGNYVMAIVPFATQLILPLLRVPVNIGDGGTRANTQNINRMMTSDSRYPTNVNTITNTNINNNNNNNRGVGMTMYTTTASTFTMDPTNININTNTMDTFHTYKSMEFGGSRQKRSRYGDDIHFYNAFPNNNINNINNNNVA
ncbi:uncharacterized protein TM35_000391410, partial [Trypanosoma theileri]